MSFEQNLTKDTGYKATRARAFQAERISYAKVPRKDPRWYDRGTVTKPEQLERSKGEEGETRRSRSCEDFFDSE